MFLLRSRAASRSHRRPARSACYSREWRSPMDQVCQYRIAFPIMLSAVIALSALGLSGAWAQSPEEALSAEEQRMRLEFFESKIRPVLIEHCYECHSGQSTIVQANLRLDSRQGIERGGDSGPAIDRAQPDASLLLQSLRYDGLQMPPSGKLPEHVVADVARWIQEGAIDPRDEAAESPPPRRWELADAESHWAFRTPKHPSVPASTMATGSEKPESSHAVTEERNAIDRWVNTQLHQRGWKPAPAADAITLLRRASLDLTGLPPSLDEIETYLADPPEDRYERLIDRLLASPQYGVRWGRHWLDAVRYADTNGADENHAMPNAWRYRDWVVAALNEDQPFDAFVTHQIAGDLLLATDDEAEQRRRITATGFWVVGPKMLAEQDKAKMRIDIVDEQIDTFSRTMLGVTLSCARCHDHKFDPLTQEDYYALAGILMSTRTMADEAFVSKWMERPLPSAARDAQRQAHQQKIDAVRRRRADLWIAANEQLVREGQLESIPEDPAMPNPKGLMAPEELRFGIEAINGELESLEKAMPAYDHAMAVEEKAPTDLPIHIRGNHLKPGDRPIPRGVPSILTRDVAIPAIEPNQSGRLQLAQWLTHPDHPLLARVMVNRIWMGHFGQPLVASPSNFGLRGDRPSHPELLDHLAREWVRQGWSMKWLHREIMLCSTYRRSSQSQQYRESDPENRWCWRQNVRRLEIEPLRDAILAIAGRLDARLGGDSQPVNSPKRTVYLNINRAALADFFSVFDYVDPASHIEQRPVTTVPSQALFLLNSDLVAESADALAQSLHQQSRDPQRWIEIAYQTLLARTPQAWERQRLLEFLQQADQAWRAEQKVAAENGAGSETQEIGWQALATAIRGLIASREFSWIE